MIQVDDNFWNLRGSFRIGGLIDVGTHSSLVRRPGGKFVLLDALAFDDETAAAVADLTFGGTAIEAVLNLHPFHTVHVEAIHRCFPQAMLIGTERHKRVLPNLPWDEFTVDHPEVHEHFGEQLAFSVPEGIDLISADEKVHCGSVLAYHRPSKTIHVDDTFNYVAKKGLIGFTPFSDSVSVHPTLGKALQKRPGAAGEFRSWMKSLIEEWGDAVNLCAAHTGALFGDEYAGASIADRLTGALKKAEETLAKHEAVHG